MVPPVEEPGKGLKQQRAYLVQQFLVALCSFFGSKSTGGVNLYNPSHLGLVDEVRADWLFTPFTGERCAWVFLYYLYIDCF